MAYFRRKAWLMPSVPVFSWRRPRGSGKLLANGRQGIRELRPKQWSIHPSPENAVFPMHPFTPRSPRLDLKLATENARTTAR